MLARHLRSHQDRSLSDSEATLGTSTDYSAPPSWGGLKADVTRAARNGLTPAKSGELLRDHIGYSGGSSRIASGGSALGSGRAAKQIASSFGGFIQQVEQVGLAEALRQNGLSELVGRSAQETLLGILTL